MKTYRVEVTGMYTQYIYVQAPDEDEAMIMAEDWQGVVHEMQPELWPETYSEPQEIT